MPEKIAIYVILAYLLDLAVGDPRWIPHPVVLIGKSIEKFEYLMRRFFTGTTSLRVAGAFTAAAVVCGSWLITYYLLQWSFSVNHWLGSAMTVLIISTTISARGLAAAGGEIYNLLMIDNLAEARRKVGWIVGRDTENMDSRGITRATVETVAENIVDGVVSPVFYAFVGGAPLAMAYRAANTLDSMLGYKNDKYIDFGMVSARFDDLVNYIPARITGLLLLAAALVLRMNPKRALKAVLKYSSGHPSPNSGIPEAAVAGALGVRLGGINTYHGRESFRAYMGEDLSPLEPLHIKKTIQLMYTTSSLAVMLGILIVILINVK